ncbi:hypothetical protein T492DRAFT_28013 [Pavlovales sp. CCMP2436]|nr:hypothetical protein T492DRAFT_28013 [Pavlovales sp. CCMP2436]
MWVGGAPFRCAGAWPHSQPTARAPSRANRGRSCSSTQRRTRSRPTPALRASARSTCAKCEWYWPGSGATPIRARPPWPRRGEGRECCASARPPSGSARPKSWTATSTRCSWPRASGWRCCAPSALSKRRIRSHADVFVQKTNAKIYQVEAVRYDLANLPDEYGMPTAVFKLRVQRLAQANQFDQFVAELAALGSRALVLERMSEMHGSPDVFFNLLVTGGWAFKQLSRPSIRALATSGIFTDVQAARLTSHLDEIDAELGSPADVEAKAEHRRKREAEAARKRAATVAHEAQLRSDEAAAQEARAAAEREKLRRFHEKESARRANDERLKARAAEEATRAVTLRQEEAGRKKADKARRQEEELQRQAEAQASREALEARRAEAAAQREQVADSRRMAQQEEAEAQRQADEERRRNVSRRRRRRQPRRMQSGNASSRPAARAARRRAWLQSACGRRRRAQNGRSRRRRHARRRRRRRPRRQRARQIGRRWAGRSARHWLGGTRRR